MLPSTQRRIAEQPKTHKALPALASLALGSPPRTILIRQRLFRQHFLSPLFGHMVAKSLLNLKTGRFSIEIMKSLLNPKHEPLQRPCSQSLSGSF